MKGANNSYIGNIFEAIRTLWAGLRLSLKHYRDADTRKKINDITNKNYFSENTGLTTLKYPHEMIPVPDTGRYRLHNEMEDCIVCDKCAKICPVDCIEIEPVRSPESFGETSDGTPKRIHAARFDINMSKCCFCGLCTTVCPTECLTMTKTFDFSEFDVREHTYEFGIMTNEEIRQRKSEWETHEKQKQASAPSVSAKPMTAKPGITPKTAGSKPVIKPKMGKPMIRPKTWKPVIKPRKPGKEGDEKGGEE